MFCTQCGRELPKQANFCQHCGKARNANVSPAPEKWEYSEIRMDFELGFLGGSHFFVADAIGPQGKFVAAKTELCALGKLEQVHTEFVRKLIDDGWEPLAGRGDTIWNLRFRREVI
jgi:hypothetical protein